MVLRSVALAFGALLLCAATEPPPPPAALEPYIKDGRYDPGDYGWIKGRFQDATAEEAEAFRAIMDWSGQCRAAAIAELREQLAAEGFAHATVENIFPGPLLCRAVASQPQIADNSSFAAFERELAAVRPLADTFLAAVELAEQSSQPMVRSEDLARFLHTRTIGEQMLRRALFWGPDMPAMAPTLSATGKAIAQSRLGLAMSARDFANTEWLKAVVAEHGWPTISAVGEEASNNAWLLVQHADADPLFQLRALRLMEPLVAQGEVSKQNYAYLYDRIMLKLSGKQRYGTQAECRGGRLVPQALEDDAAVNRLRQEVGLGTVEEYMAVMNERSGPCQDFPRPAAR
jgi:hypothetical protein